MYVDQEIGQKRGREEKKDLAFYHIWSLWNNPIEYGIRRYDVAKFRCFICT